MRQSHYQKYTRNYTATVAFEMFSLTALRGRLNCNALQSAVGQY